MFLRNLTVAAALLIGSSSALALTPIFDDSVADTKFTTAYGQTLHMKDLKGEVVVLTYWVHDCVACEQQLQILDSYYRQRRGVGLRVMAIAAEDWTDRQLRAKFKDRLIHPLAKISGPFEPREGLPTTFVIDRYGKVRHVATEEMSLSQLNEVLVPLLKQPQP